MKQVMVRGAEWFYEDVREGSHIAGTWTSI